MCIKIKVHQIELELIIDLKGFRRVREHEGKEMTLTEPGRQTRKKELSSFLCSLILINKQFLNSKRL